MTIFDLGKGVMLKMAQEIKQARASKAPAPAPAAAAGA